MTIHNLPQNLMPFVGREQEIEEISNLLDEVDCRLLSLIAPGGMGKTRLSLEVAERKLGSFPDGVFFVALQALSSADSMTTAIASAMNFSVQNVAKNTLEQILDYLAEKQLLLIMDNFEHLLDGVDIVAQILHTAPQVKILITSREALNLQTEWVRPVSGMTVPENANSDTLENYSAVKLFVQRARRVNQEFSENKDISCIIRICQLVGGMPLGIELAASWLKSLSCNRLADEIQASADILMTKMRDIPDRHRSIRAVFNYAWTGLSEEEKMTFARLSVFQTAPTLHAIQAVTGANLLTISDLVDKALLAQSDDNRYQFHELLRQYAREKLIESGEQDRIRDAHSHYYLEFMQEAEHGLRGHRQYETLVAITIEFENVRSAWHRALETLNYDGIGMAVEPLASYLWTRSRWTDESHLLVEAEKQFHPKSDEEAHPVFGMVLARNSANHSDPIADLGTALDIAKKYGDENEIGMCLHMMGHVYQQMGVEYDQEHIHFHQKSIPYFEASGNHFHLAEVYMNVGYRYISLGDYENALNYIEQSYEIQQTTGDIIGQTGSLSALANIHFATGNLQETDTYWAKTVSLAEQAGHIARLIINQAVYAMYVIYGSHGDLDSNKIFDDSLQSLEHNLPNKYWKLIIVSLNSVLQQDYHKAIQSGIDATNLAEEDNHYWTPAFAWGLIMASCELEDFATVREYNDKILSFFPEKNIPLLMLGITFSAILAAYDEKNPKRATELLALVSTHPGSMKGWLKLWDFIGDLQVHLENELGSDAYQKAWERGKNLEWQFVVTELIAQQENSQDSEDESAIPAHVLEANSALFEPLSERELEVLLKIAEGHSNKEIAEQLFVGVSTIKKHITHIYGKLAVGSRTQALLKAQELKLIHER